jgi:cytochrome c-type biogenesis protein CcmH/NrfF
MHRLKRSLLFLVLVGAALLQIASAQTESQIESDEVKRVGTHLNCQCGSCQENLNCNMSSGQCHFCKPARTKIWELQKTGMDDPGIIAFFKKQYGDVIFRADPNSFFWLIPYLTLAAGGGVLWIVLKKMRGTKNLTPAVAGTAPAHDPVLERYRDVIEKDTDKLD